MNNVYYDKNKNAFIVDYGFCKVILNESEYYRDKIIPDKHEYLEDGVIVFFTNDGEDDADCVPVRLFGEDEDFVNIEYSIIDRDENLSFTHGYKINTTNTDVYTNLSARACLKNKSCTKFTKIC